MVSAKVLFHGPHDLSTLISLSRNKSPLPTNSSEVAEWTYTRDKVLYPALLSRRFTMVLLPRLCELPPWPRATPIRSLKKNYEPWIAYTEETTFVFCSRDCLLVAKGDGDSGLQTILECPGFVLSED